MNARPSVSIGLPVYNGEHYLSEALDSLLVQTYRDFELIISDNASSDATPKLAAEYAARDSRIRYYRNPRNVGAIENFNRVVRLSSGRYFMWAADHDRWHPEFVTRCVDVLESDPAIVLCHAQTRWIESNGSLGEYLHPDLDTRRLGPVSRYRRVVWSVGHCYQIYGLMRAKELKRTGIYRSIIGPDILLLAELALLGAFAYVPEPLLFLRRMPDHGSWESYLQKLHKQVPGWRKPSLYYEMVARHLDVINKSVDNDGTKAILTASALLCMLVKYKWVLRESLGIKKWW